MRHVPVAGVARTLLSRLLDATKTTKGMGWMASRGMSANELRRADHPVARRSFLPGSLSIYARVVVVVVVVVALRPEAARRLRDGAAAPPSRSGVDPSPLPVTRTRTSPQSEAFTVV